MFDAKLVKIDRVFFSPALHKGTCTGQHADINVVKHFLSAGDPKTINLLFLHYYSISDKVKCRAAVLHCCKVGLTGGLLV